MNIEEQRDTLIQKGYNEKRAGNYESSINCYLDALQLDPYEGMAHYSLGKVLFLAERYYHSTLFYLRALHLAILYSANGPDANRVMLEHQATEMIGAEKLADFKKKFHPHVPFLVVQTNIMHHFGRSYAIQAPPKSAVYNHVREDVNKSGQDYSDNMNFYRQGLAGHVNEYIKNTEGYREKIDNVYENIAFSFLIRMVQWERNENPFSIYPNDYFARGRQ